MNIFYIFIYFILILWIHWLWSRRQFYSLMFKIRGSAGYPLIGMSLQLKNREDILTTFANEIKKYGSTTLTWIWTHPSLIVTEPAIVQEILTSRNCINKAVLYKAIDKAIGKGLISLKDPEWSIHRKLLNPAFSYKVLMNFIPIFNSEFNGFLTTMDQMTKKNAVDIMGVLHELNLNITTKTTMGGNVSQGSSESYKKLISAFQMAMDSITEMIFAPWLTLGIVRRLLGIYTPFNEAKDYILQFIRKLVKQKLNEEKDGGDSGSKHIFIDLAIDLMRRENFSYEDVERESNIIVLSGFETSANTVGYVLMLLAMFPEYQERAFEELKSLFPKTGEFDVTYDHIKDMTYLDMIINETMRVMAPAPIVGRQVSQDFKLSNGIVLPKGLTICIDIFHMHRRIDIWGPNANIFNPDNFLPENLEDKHPYAYIPFTKGLRDCIGKRYAYISMKIALAKFLRNYYFTTEFKFEDLEFIEDLTIKLKHNPLLKIEKRKE